MLPRSRRQPWGCNRPVGEQPECTSQDQKTNQMKVATVFFPQTFPFEVAGGSLRGGSLFARQTGG
jgi:hypothetical protein